MEIPQSFAQTLAKLESQVKKMNMSLSNTRQLFEYGNMELTYEVALRVADIAERTVLLARALPAYTGHPLATHEVENLIQINIPVEIGFTAEGWFSVRLPLLLPKKEDGSADYIRSFLYAAMRNFFRGKTPVRYHDCVLVYRHVYSDRGRNDSDVTMIISKSIWFPILLHFIPWKTTEPLFAVITTVVQPERQNGQRFMWCRRKHSSSG